MTKEASGIHNYGSDGYYPLQRWKMRKMPLQSAIKKRLALAGIAFCLCVTLFLSCVSVGSVGVSLLSGFKPIQSGPYLYLHGADDAVYVLNAYSGTIHRQYNLNYRQDIFNSDYLSEKNVIDDQSMLFYEGYRGIYAARAQDGSLLWKHYLSTIPFGNVSLLAVIGGTLFAQSDFMLYALHASDGTLLWEHDLSKDFTAKEIYSISDVLVANGVLSFDVAFETTENPRIEMLFAMSARNGSFLWKQVVDNLSISQVVDGVFYFANDTTLYAYRMRDGLLLWKRSGANAITSLVVSKGIIIVSDTSNIYTLRISDHSFPVWIYHYNDGAATYQLFVTNDTVYTNTLALRIDNGQLLWRYPNGALINPVDDANSVQNIVYGYRVVSVSQSSNIVYLEAIQRSSGAVVWQQKINMGGLQGTIISHGVIFLLDYKVVYGYAASTGQFLWLQNLPLGPSGPDYLGYYMNSSFLTVDDV